MFTFSADLTPTQIKKMRKGYDAFRKDMLELRDLAAKRAKFTDKEYLNYRDALSSPDCQALGPLASKRAAEIARISEVKFKNFAKHLALLKKEYKQYKKLAKNSSFTLSSSDLSSLRAELNHLAFYISECLHKQRQADSAIDHAQYQDRINALRHDYTRLHTMLSSADPRYENSEPVKPEPVKPEPVKPEPKAENAAPKANISPTSRKLLDSSFKLAKFMNLIQSDEFFDWFSDHFSAWLADSEGSPSDDQIVEWVAQHLS